MILVDCEVKRQHQWPINKKGYIDLCDSRKHYNGQQVLHIIWSCVPIECDKFVD